MGSSAATAPTVYNPLSIILVKNGSKGERLLFRWPDPKLNRKDEPDETISAQPKKCQPSTSSRRSRFSVAAVEDYIFSNTDADPVVVATTSASVDVPENKMGNFSDKILQTLFAVKSDLAEKRLEVKVNDVRFISHPTNLTRTKSEDISNAERKPSNIFLVNVVIALQAAASPWVVQCLYALSRQLGEALKSEEQRCGYLSKQAKIMLSILDEAETRERPVTESPFEAILTKSSLAKELRDIYLSLRESGTVNQLINHFFPITFCLPQKVHFLQNNMLHIEPSSIYSCLMSIRPYHGMVLLSDQPRSLPPGCSASIMRAFKFISPLKTFQDIAALADLSLPEVFQLAALMLYWAEALIIFPICESSVYVLAPDAPLPSRQMAQEFSETFPGVSLASVLAEFSLPTSMAHKRPYASSTGWQLEKQQNQEVRLIVWLLRRRLLMQIHTFVYFCPQLKPPTPPHTPRISTPGSRRYPESTQNSVIGSPPQLLGGRGSTRSRASNSSRQSTPDILPCLLSDDQISDDVSSSIQSLSVASGTAESVPVPGHHEEVGSPAPLPPLVAAPPPPPPPPPPKEEELESARLFAQAVKILPQSLTSEEIEAIIDCPAAACEDDLRAFSRLFPYFNGQCHLEHIMFSENINRSQLIQVIEKFWPVLVLCQHEDSHLSVFYQHRRPP